MTVTAFPADGRRLVVYSMHDTRGDIQDSVLHALAGLRPHAAHVLVVVSGRLTAASRKTLLSVVDDVVRCSPADRGLWAHRAALAHLGSAVEQYDEVLMTGDGWFGPVRSFDPLFAQLNDRPVDLWGITDRRDPRPGHPAEDEGAIVSISPTWIAARKRLVASSEWGQFWRRLPARRPEGWPGHLEELRMSSFLADRGWSIGVAFAHSDYPSDQPELFNAELLLADGCPVVSRSVFDNYPLFLDQFAVIGRRVARLMEEAGYPIALLWRNLARTVSPKTLNTNAAMLEVLPDVARNAPDPARRILAILHLARSDGTDELFQRVRSVPGILDVVITVPDAAEVEVARDLWQRSGPAGDIASVEVRLAPGRTGADTAVVFAECADLLERNTHDLVIAMHTGTPPGRVRNVARYFRRQQYESLLSSAGYVANLLALFDREPGLGMVFPLTPHIGMSTLGSGWGGSKDRAEAVAQRLGIRVPFDWASPHAPLGGMWIGRPAAVSRLQGLPLAATDPELIEVHTLLLAYAAGENGFHTRTVATAEHAGLSHGSLEYTLDHMSMTMYGYPAGYTALLHRAGPVGTGRAVDFARMYLGYRRPRVLRITGRAARVARRARAILRTLTRRTTSQGRAE